MGLMDLLSGLRRRQAEREQTAAEQYAEMVLSCADDEAMDEDVAAEILEESGHTPEDLAADVAAEQERRVLVAQVEQEADVRDELRTSRQQADEAEADFIQIREQHVAKIDDLKRRCGVLSARLQEIGKAKQRLEGYSQAGDEELHLQADLRDVQKQIEQARRRPAMVQQEKLKTEMLQAKIADLPVNASDDQREEFERRLADAEGRLKEARGWPADVGKLQIEEQRVARQLKDARTRRLVSAGSKWDA